MESQQVSEVFPIVSKLLKYWDHSNTMWLQDAVFVPAPEKTEGSEPVYFLTEKSDASEEPVWFLNSRIVK